MHIDELAWKRRGHSCFCAWPHWIYICRSFPFRCNIYGKRVFKWITQRVLLSFVLVKLLVFAPLLNAPKKHVLNYFGLEIAARRRHRKEQRASGRRRRGRIFSTLNNLFWMPDKHIIRAYHLPMHVLFQFASENKRRLGTRIHNTFAFTANINSPFPYRTYDSWPELCFTEILYLLKK